jgi:hypothetical protein
MASTRNREAMSEQGDEQGSYKKTECSRTHGTNFSCLLTRASVGWCALKMLLVSSLQTLKMCEEEAGWDCYPFIDKKTMLRHQD